MAWGVHPRLASGDQAFLDRVLHKFDAIVHIDPEDDSTSAPNIHLPPRDTLLRHLQERLGSALPTPEQVILHYLDGRAEAEVFLPAPFFDDQEKRMALERKIFAMTPNDEYFVAIHLHSRYAPE